MSLSYAGASVCTHAFLRALACICICAQLCFVLLHPHTVDLRRNVVLRSIGTQFIRYQQTGGLRKRVTVIPGVCMAGKVLPVVIVWNNLMHLRDVNLPNNVRHMVSPSTYFVRFSLCENVCVIV